MNQAPWVTLIIACYNDGKWLPRCLESFRKQTIFPHLEILLVDNASQDGTDALAQNLITGWSNARLIPAGKNLGFGGANNLGALAAGGRYLMFLNSDIWMESDCVELLFKAAESTGAAAAGAQILNYSDDSVQAKGCDGFDLFGELVAPRDGGDPQILFSAANFLFIRRDAFLEVGMMDEKSFMYGEELDISWRLWLSGRTIVPVMAAKIHHRGAAFVNPAGGTQIVENRTSSSKRYFANRNRLLTIAKNGQHILLLMLLPATALVLLEASVTLVMTRSWSLARSTCLVAITDAWGMRDYVLQRRRQIKAVRRRGDFWLLRFFRFGFGRSQEVANIWRGGFPKINRS